MKKVIITFVITIILFLTQDADVHALVKYDDNKSYSMNDMEILNITNEQIKEQTEKNAQQLENKQVDIIVFAGQDNMRGSEMPEEITTESIWNSGYELRYNAGNHVIGIKRLCDSERLNSTLIPAFVNSYYNNTGAPVLAIDVTKRTSSINDWSENGEKYKELKTKLEEGIKYVTNNPQSFTLRNIYMVWYQGESDVYDLENYEIKLTKFLENVKSLGVKQNFMIRIGHLYRASGTSDDNRQRDSFDSFTQMIKLQTEFNRKSDLSVLVSTKAAVLSLVKGPSSDREKISDMMINQLRLSQRALEIVGSEAGKNAAYYVNKNKEPRLLDLEYKDDDFDYYYTGFDDSQGLTDLQSKFLYKKMKKYIKEGNESGVLQYGSYAKQRAYQLELVSYNEEYLNGNKIIYMDNGFKSGNYIGLDCSGFTSFVYHYTFGLPFDYTRYAPTVNGRRAPIKGTPWTTREYLNNPTSLEFGKNNKISTLKYVGELKSETQDYTLYSAAQNFPLRTGDLIIGKNNDIDAHIVIYIGKDSINGNHVVLNSTSLSNHNVSNNGIRYHVDFAYLTPDNFDGATNFSHKYTDVTVLRLNNNVMPNNFIGNEFNVNFSNLQTKVSGYKFQGLYKENTEIPDHETWLENHSVYISKEENQL